MQSEFVTYLQLGLQHIADINAYDHILFVIALCAIYQLTDWKKILILVTAFTVGHSLTLALAALDILRFPSSVIEFLIPVTILITALLNFKKSTAITQLSSVQYLLPLGFGFIHGMGFSNYFKSLLGKEESIVKPLFAFNVGIELGQIGIVLSYLVLTYVLVKFIKIPHSIWFKIVLAIIAALALYLMWETKFW